MAVILESYETERAAFLDIVKVSPPYRCYKRRFSADLESDWLGQIAKIKVRY